MKKEAMLYLRWKHLDTKGEPEFTALIEHPILIENDAQYKLWERFRQGLALRIRHFEKQLRPQADYRIHHSSRKDPA